MKVTDVRKLFDDSNMRLGAIMSDIESKAPLLYSAGLKRINEVLGMEKRRNSLGLIRALVVGQSNSGKSTMINALAGKVLVPEVAYTSTLIPTWLGQTDNFAEQGVGVDYYDVKDKERKNLLTKPEGFDDFRRMYCYRAEDLADRKRLKKPPFLQGMDLREAYVRFEKHEGLIDDLALVLVDTLGNGVSVVDDEKARQNMGHCDMAFVLISSNGVMQQGDIDFLATSLLNPQVSRIKPEHIIFVVNKIDLSPSPVESVKCCKLSIKALLEKAKIYSDTLYERMCANVVTFSALFDRLAFVGEYPYRSDSMVIDGITASDFEHPSSEAIAEAVKIVQQKERFERRIMRMYEKDEMLETANHKAFCNKIVEVVSDMFADCTISTNHLNAIHEYATDMKLQVKSEIDKLESNVSDIDATISAFQEAKKQIQAATDKFDAQTNQLIINFPGRVNEYVKSNAELFLVDIAGDINETIENAKIDVDPSQYTVDGIRKKGVQKTSEEFGTCFNGSIDKMTDLITASICNNAFAPTVVGVRDGEAYVAETPYTEIITNLLIPAIDAYLNGVLDMLKTVNEQKEVIKFQVVDKKYFLKPIDDGLKNAKLHIMEHFRDNVKQITDQNMGGVMQEAIHGFWKNIWAFFGGYSVEELLQKMEKAAKKHFTLVINQVLLTRMNSGFLNGTQCVELAQILTNAVYKCRDIVNNYVGDIDKELARLKSDKELYASRTDSFTKYVQEHVYGPLDAVISENQKMAKVLEEEGIQMD